MTTKTRILRYPLFCHALLSRLPCHDFLFTLLSIYPCPAAALPAAAFFRVG